ncbi:MAG: methyltransferase [Pseudomonadota bacterium]
MGRLSHAVDAGVISLPETGTIAVIEPPVGYDVSALPKDRVEIIASFKPAHDAFAAAGYHVDVVVPNAAALMVVVAGKSKSRTRGHIAMAALSAAPIVVDGDKTAGIDSLYRDLKSKGDLTPAHAKAHGKVFQLTPGPGVLDWLPQPGEVDGFRTWPGVFSEAGIDKGSEFLAATLPPLKGQVADLGSGWGYLSERVLRNSDAIAELHMVEADAHAGACGRDNVKDPRAVHHWADAAVWSPDGPMDVVITNPPFHVGRASDPSLGQAFITAAARILQPKGALWLVANRQLPYEGSLDANFREVDEVKSDPAYKIFHARKPRTR